MPARRPLAPRAALFAALACLALTAPAAAQYVVFPRLGLSAAPDRYEPDVTVRGQDTFELYVLVLPPEGEPALAQEFGTFHWAVLEACCGGAATVVDAEWAPAYDHDGDLLFGVVSSSEECFSGPVIELCRLTLRMTVDVSGSYYIIAGPLSLAQTCDQQGVVMTDLIVNIHYTADTTPTALTSWSGVKNLFR